MRHQYLYFFLLIIVSLAACSGDNGNNKKSAPEKITQDVAEKAVDYIQSPIDKAHKAAAAAAEHSQQIKENAQ